ncbi:unnamed protein product [Merluccius merluccius]
MAPIGRRHTAKTPHLRVREEADTRLYSRRWMVPRHLKVPFTMMANRVQSASHSSMLLVVEAHNNNNDNDDNNNSHQPIPLTNLHIKLNNPNNGPRVRRQLPLANTHQQRRRRAANRAAGELGVGRLRCGSPAQRLCTPTPPPAGH